MSSKIDKEVKKEKVEKKLERITPNRIDGKLERVSYKPKGPIEPLRYSEEISYKKKPMLHSPQRKCSRIRKAQETARRRLQEIREAEYVESVKSKNKLSKIKTNQE